jgi:hypothetical protein
MKKRVLAQFKMTQIAQKARSIQLNHPTLCFTKYKINLGLYPEYAVQEVAVKL